MLEWQFYSSKLTLRLKVSQTFFSGRYSWLLAPLGDMFQNIILTNIPIIHSKVTTLRQTIHLVCSKSPHKQGCLCNPNMIVLSTNPQWLVWEAHSFLWLHTTLFNQMNSGKTFGSFSQKVVFFSLYQIQKYIYSQGKTSKQVFFPNPNKLVKILKFGLDQNQRNVPSQKFNKYHPWNLLIQQCTVSQTIPLLSTPKCDLMSIFVNCATKHDHII